MIDRRRFLSAMGITGMEVMLPHQLPVSFDQLKETELNNIPSAGEIELTPHSFAINGHKMFLISGEMHYFRTPKSDWRRRMQLFKEAGGNCISTYVPWAIHEPDEGKFLFDVGDGIHDFEAFLDEAQSVGLYVIARPGPYVGSELKYGGLPAWLCEGYPQIRACGVDGGPLGTASVSYMHPVYLEKVNAWFQHIGPRIARHTVQQGGSVAMLQLDNELMGIHIWRGSLDYNREGMGIEEINGRYPRYLCALYRDIPALNDAYGTRFDSFESVTPINPAHCSNLHDLLRAKDYFDFYLNTVAEYTKILADLIRAHGINVTLTHNAAGVDMNPLFLETARLQGEGFLLGTDHYYNLGQDWGPANPTPQLAVNIFCSLETLRLMGYPPTVLELQGGSPCDWPPIRANDCAAWYWTNLAYGMKGSNYYMFTGGQNPLDMGTTSDSYDYQAAIGSAGEVRPLYSVQKRFGTFLRCNAWITQTQRTSDFRLGFDFDVPRAAPYWKYENNQIFSYPAAWQFLRKGLLTSALCASLSPEFCDLASDEWLHGQPMPLIVPGSTCMAEAKQKRIIRYFRNGNHALITPVLPEYDDSFKPSTALVNFLGRPIIERFHRDFVRINISGIRNIVNNGALFTTTRLPAGAEVLGIEECTGKVVAWQLNTEGGGKAIFLGMSWSHAMRQHQDLITILLGRLGAIPKVICSNPNVWTCLRTDGTKSVLLLLNLSSCAADTDIACNAGPHMPTLGLGRHHLDPMTVKLIEV